MFSLAGQTRGEDTVCLSLPLLVFVKVHTYSRQLPTLTYPR